MAESRVERLVDTAAHHLGHVAYRTQDNPFLRSVGSSRSWETAREGVLRHLRVQAALPVAHDLGQIAIGVVPRDVEISLLGGGRSAAVSSVTAFADASPEWWLISHLWCLEVGRQLDPLIPPRQAGNRLHRSYILDPETWAFTFRPARRPADFFGAYLRASAARSAGGKLCGATTDLRSFYYSVDASPSTILETFGQSTGVPIVLSSLGRQLTNLLDRAHEEHAAAAAEVQPRGGGPEIGSCPLPVGLPSSQVLSNLVVAVALGELMQLDAVFDAAAYVDDLLLVSPVLPLEGEDHLGYLRRIDVAKEREDGVLGLAVDDARHLASFVLAEGKGDTSLIQVPDGDTPPSSDVDGEPDEDGFWVDPYFDLPDEPPVEDSGEVEIGGLFRTPFRTRRVSPEAVKRVAQLADEIRIGADRTDAQTSLAQLNRTLDPAARLELRPYWSDLAASVHYAAGPPGLSAMLAALADDFESISSVGTASARGVRVALQTGLRFALRQALVEALAATARSSADTEMLDGEVVHRAVGIYPAQVAELVQGARASRFVRSHLVSAPLSEFTDWQGPLFGNEAVASFESWARENPEMADAGVVAARVGDAKRFIPLHEACLSVHLWSNPGAVDWDSRVFSIFRGQPLIAAESVDYLRRAVARVVSPRVASKAKRTISRVGVRRFAIPSIGVAGDQLKALVAQDGARLSAVARAARWGIITTTREAAQRSADAMVFPEWSLPARQLPWIFERSAKEQMLIVGGEGPRLRPDEYSNRIWTGIPIRDASGRRTCVVPPPREKLYLSDDEILDKGEVPQARRASRLPVYRWDGVDFASLICFEFADIRVREKLRTRADLLTVSSWNRDWRYFSAIQEATTRDNYCLSICVNTSQYPGTQIMRPTKNEKAIALSVHGATDPAVIVREVDMRPVLAARRLRTRPKAITWLSEPEDDLDLEDYKPLPPRLR